MCESVGCKTKTGAFACGNKCGAVYCSEQCADKHWYDNQHYLACGDYLDELPKEALVVVLSHMSFKDAFKNSLISKKFASVINTYSFRKLFAQNHKGEWEKRVRNWFLNHRIDIIKTWLPILIETKAWNPAANDNYAIRRASENGHAEVVKLLLETGKVDPAAHNNEAICLASEHGHAEVVKLLLKTGLVNPAANDNYDAIYLARVNGHVKVVALLEDYIRREQDRKAGKETETKRLKLLNKI